MWVKFRVIARPDRKEQWVSDYEFHKPPRGLVPSTFGENTENLFANYRLQHVRIMHVQYIVTTHSLRVWKEICAEMLLGINLIQSNEIYSSRNVRYRTPLRLRTVLPLRCAKSRSQRS